MPTNKDFKRIVRQRMAETGENYTKAHAALSGDTTIPPRATWLDSLADPARQQSAYESAATLPEDQRRAGALQGLTHDSWRVRRSCARLLDDLDLTEETISALTAALDDPHPRVRRAALHTLTCEPCKPSGCPLDTKVLRDRMAADPSRLVREVVLGTAAWGDVRDGWGLSLLERFARSDPSLALRETARQGLEKVARMQQLDEQRRQLPEPLRTLTERHGGKWIGVAGGTVIAAGPFPGRIRKALREAGAPDGAIYWVAP